MRDVKADIFNCGRKLFGSQGFKHTSILDIAIMANIGVGTFYNYYSSKEKLFLEIYIKENEMLEKSITEAIDLNDDPIVVIAKLVIKSISTKNSNMILKEWYNRELFGKLEHCFYEQGSLESIDEFLHSGTAELIRKWKAEGKIRVDIEDEMINALFIAILYIEIHKSEIGIQYFPLVLQYITEFIMNGLADCPQNTDQTVIFLPVHE